MSLTQEPPLETEPHWVQAGTWTQAFDHLDTTVNEILTLDTRQAGTGEIPECLVRFQATKNRLCAAETTMLGAFDRSQDWRADGSKSAAGWLAARSKTPRKALQGLVRLAKRLRRMPRTHAALSLGVIDQSRAEALSRLADSPRPAVRDAFQEHEGVLVGLACDLDEDGLARALGYWRDAADPDGSEDKAHKHRDNRRVHLSQTIGGTWFLDGQLDPVAGAEVAEALRRIEQDLFKVDWDAARKIHGTDTRVEHLDRTAPQRRADALVEMARQAMAAPPGARLPRPLVSALVGYETFNGTVRELFNRTVLSPGQVAALLTEADIERVVYTNAGRDISDLGRRARFFTPAQRRVIELRDRVCYHPTCDTSAEHCQMDHKHPWMPDGDTNIDNGQPACPKHNNDRNKHGPPADPHPLE